MILDINGVMKLLPHRPPFLFVDAVEELEPVKRIVAIKNVTMNEDFFRGHFPEKPVMPAVLILECMAQTAALMMLQEIPDRDKKLLYFAAVDNAKFRRPVFPGDQLKIEAKVVNWRGTIAKFEARAYVGGELTAEADLLAKMVDRVPAQGSDTEPVEKVR